MAAAAALAKMGCRMASSSASPASNASAGVSLQILASFSGGANMPSAKGQHDAGEIRPPSPVRTL